MDKPTTKQLARLQYELRDVKKIDRIWLSPDNLNKFTRKEISELIDLATKERYEEIGIALGNAYLKENEYDPKLEADVDMANDMMNEEREKEAGEYYSVTGIYPSEEMYL